MNARQLTMIAWIFTSSGGHNISILSSPIIQLKHYLLANCGDSTMRNKAY